MNARFTLLLLAVALSAPAGRAAFVNGHSYQPLENWADANGFHAAAWHGNQITLTNRTARLMVEKDSRTAQFNGVNVALSFPVAVDKGQFLVAALDLNRTLGPLLYPPKLAGKKISTIVLDPGHGGKDPGNRFAGRSEKTATLALADDVRDQLVAAGFRVILTRTSDKVVELPVRPDIANRARARRLDAPGSAVALRLIPTNEEAVIVRQTASIAARAKARRM